MSGEVSVKRSMRRVALTEAMVVAALRAEFGAGVDYCRPSWRRAAGGFVSAQRGKPTPPIGEQIGEAMRRAEMGGGPVACLVPGRMDTAWWWSYAPLAEVRILRGRVRFEGHPSGAPFPSAVFLFPFEHRVCFWDVKAGASPEVANVTHWERPA